MAGRTTHLRAWAPMRCAVALAVLTCAGVAAAAAPDPVAGAPPPADGDSVLRASSNPLELDEKQRERIAKIVEESGAHAEQLKRQLADARADLKQSLDAPEPEFGEVMRGVERVGHLETEMRKHRIATLMSLRALLSPDQRADLGEFLRVASERQQRKTRSNADEAATAPEQITSSLPKTTNAPATTP